MEGSGTPVVLVHGFGEDSTIWDKQVKFLKDHCLVITPDIPGSGKSSILEGLSQAITLGDYAICIHALLLHEKIERCIILGHSMGGYITLAFEQLYPNMVSGFGFINSTVYPDTDEKKENRQRGIELMEKHGAYSFLKNTIPNLFSANFKEQHAEVVNELIEKARSFDTLACQQYYTAMMNRPDRSGALKNTKVPVFIIAGTEDVAAPIKDVLEQSSLPTVAFIHVLENVGHMAMLEATEKVNQYILDFISKVD